MAATAAQASFRKQLVDAGALLPTGVAGVFGQGGALLATSSAVDALIGRSVAGEHALQLSFPPVMPRRVLEDNGYLGSCPQLAATVFAFTGDEAAAGEQAQLAAEHGDWGGHQSMTDVVMVPAACHPVYPALAAAGAVPQDGRTVDAGAGWVFRREPSEDPARMQAFRQRELVRVGSAEDVAGWRDRWRDRAAELLGGLGLATTVAEANDPFFGRTGRLLARSQRAQQLKFEVLVPIAGPDLTAVASFNAHGEHFAGTFGLQLADGTTAHTACLGFGLERVALALLRAHGLEPDCWPRAVRGELWP